MHTYLVYIYIYIHIYTLQYLIHVAVMVGALFEKNYNYWNGNNRIAVVEFVEFFVIYLTLSFSLFLCLARVFHFYFFFVSEN